MNKILLGIGLVLILVLGYFFIQGDQVDYVATVNSEVAELEAELATIDAAVNAGTLTPTAAAEAQIKILARLDTINTAVAASGGSKLSEEQKQLLIAGLDRFQGVLSRYGSTLVSVDAAAMELPESERPKLNRGGRGGNHSSISAALEATSEALVDLAEDVFDGYVAEEPITDMSDEAMMDGDIVDEDTEEMMDDMIDDTMDDDMMDGDMSDDHSASTSGEADVEVSAEEEVTAN